MNTTLASYYKRLATLRAKRDAINEDISRVLGYVAKLEAMEAYAKANPGKKRQNPADSR